MKYDLEIRSYIENWTRYQVQEVLSENPDTAVRILINSYGGNLEAAISIYHMFSNHGKVHVYLEGFVASAATILSLGAQKINMSEYSMYLAHKCSVEVCTWGYLNSDQLQGLIEELERDKSRNDKIDKIIASMYAKRTGLPADRMTKMITDGIWLNCEECMELHLVDDVYNGGTSVAVDDNVRGIMNAYEYPIPTLPESHPSTIRSLLSSLVNVLSTGQRITPLVPHCVEEPPSLDPLVPSPPDIAINMSFTHIMNLLGVQELTESEGTVSLTMEQLSSIENALPETVVPPESTTIAALNDRLSDLTTEVEALKRAPGAKTITQRVDVPQDTDHRTKARNLLNII